MKAFGLIALLLTMAIGGYIVMLQMKAGNSGPAIDANGARGVEAAVAAAHKAVNTDKVAEIQRLVKGFQDLHSRLPTSLEELKTSGMVDEIPAGLNYNAETGEVTAAP
jgi:hypothetical protein